MDLLELLSRSDKGHGSFPNSGSSSVAEADSILIGAWIAESAFECRQEFFSKKRVRDLLRRKGHGSLTVTCETEPAPESSEKK